ncbi:hypothetical protein F383_35360 [Gossypium arboreum]|uniref:Uncharacterized protein n=1 Tax=Gossypium arboreum TaxID=29729 RepID=A0A0B0PUZ1_GOSAR|nr:hypothetical protein F383_35360 [Gossypium arboreum]
MCIRCLGHVLVLSVGYYMYWIVGNMCSTKYRLLCITDSFCY